MGKLLVTTITLLSISYQLQTGMAFDAIGMASSLIGLGQFLVDTLDKLMPKERVVDELMIGINELSSNVLYDTGKILDNMKDLREQTRHDHKEETLQTHFARITRIFGETLQLKEVIDSGIIYYNSSHYHTFSTKGNEIDESISEIRRMLTDSDKQGFVLSQGFISNLKRFEDTCRTGMSDLQLIDNLLSNIRFITAKYFWAKKYMYDFLELLSENNTQVKRGLLKTVSDDYVKVAKVFQTVMTNMSTELYKCDPRRRFDNSIRFTNVEDPNYGEIRAFSKYLVSEETIAKNSIGCYNDERCPMIRKVKKCDEFCQITPPCPGDLIGCEQISYSYASVDVCLNDDKQSYYRYRSIVPRTSKEPFHCDAKYKKSRISVAFLRRLGNHDYCHECQCICENYLIKNSVKYGYFIDGLAVKSETVENRVVTGARLVVQEFKSKSAEGKMLRIQIEEATLLTNGTISEKQWTPLTSTKNYTDADFKIIRWNRHRKFHLSPVLLPEDHIVTGLQFESRNGEKDIILSVLSNKVNYRTGSFDSIAEKYSNDNSSKKPYDVSNADVPTKSRHENDVFSTDDQYVELTLTNLEKDAGQSTVPFIDSQRLSANMPLGGASLYVRGQPGYAGFLGIKLYTFNTVKYINTKTELHDYERHRSLLIENFNKDKIMVDEGTERKYEGKITVTVV